MISWRDIKSPFAGGAELLTHQMLRRMTKEYDITVLSSAFPGGKKKEKIDKVIYLRLGDAKKNYINAYNWRIYFSVFYYWWKNIRGKEQFDVTIEQINNVPFFYSLYADTNAVVFIHQLCRKNWFYQTPGIVAVIGYFLFEPLYLWLLRHKQVITVSNSTKNDLSRYGYKKEHIHIISEGSMLKRAVSIKLQKKSKICTILSLGNIRPMKRVHVQIQAFEYAKKQMKNLRLVIAGDAAGAYGGQTLLQINNSPYRDSISYIGRISEKQKSELLRASHMILMTSEREGWGLVVTEAASQGVPAIVFDSPGLRDSVRHNQTGIICKANTPKAMGNAIVALAKHKKTYWKLASGALQMSRDITFDKSADDCLTMLKNKEQVVALETQVVPIKSTYAIAK